MPGHEWIGRIRQRWRTAADRWRRHGIAGLQALRHRAVLSAARVHARTRLLLFVRSTNVESLKGVRRSGCKQIGSVWIRTRGDRTKFRVEITDPAWSAVVAVPSEIT